MRIILASQSPRRRELLERMGLRDFRIVTPDIDERSDRPLPPHGWWRPFPPKRPGRWPPSWAGTR